MNSPRTYRRWRWLLLAMVVAAGSVWLIVIAPFAIPAAPTVITTHTAAASRDPASTNRSTTTAAAMKVVGNSSATRAGEMCGYPVIDTPAYAHPSTDEARKEAERLVPAVYEDVGRDLGLTETQRKRLLEMLMDHYVQLESPKYPDDAPQSVVDEFLAQARARQAAELQNLLGAEGTAAMARYRKTNEARYEVESLRQELATQESPLSEPQRRRLVNAILRPGTFIGHRDFSGSESPAAVRQEVRARLEQNERQLRTIAASVLDADQLDVLDDYLESRRDAEIERWTPHFARTEESDDAEVK